MSQHKTATEFQNYMIAKRPVPPVATVTGNLPFLFLFFFLPESGLECICVAVGRSRKPQSNPDSPPIDINWQNSHWLHWGQEKVVNGQGEVIWCFWLLRFCRPSVSFYFSSIWCCCLQCEYDHVNVNWVPKSNRAHCLAWDLITKAFCDSRQLIFLVKSYPR